MRRALIDWSRLAPAAPLLSSVALLALTLLAMHWSAQSLARQSSQLFGRRLQLYLFGLPGTIVHEGSHVIACVLFRHRVHRVKWFDPSATDGALGSVEHSYDPSSAYQRVGTIVIGLAPLLAGAAVLLLAARLLLGVPLVPLADLTQVAAWRWTLFAYVSLSVGGSMHLSASDVRGTWRGVVTLGVWIAAALLLSLAVWWALLQLAPTVWPAHVAPLLRQAATSVARASDVLSGALQLSVVVNVAGTVLLFVVRRLVRVVR
ncbi:MAG: hypothetical protein CK550_04200 [Gemmatimonadetes bacterium]|nr:MAG: hypothetical protein CK550_04200 [Gemmatimonadota bacterium]